MKILFIDSGLRSYDTTTYLKQPLGGTQSAVAGLALELVRAGHEAAIINGVAEPIETDGVRFMNLPCPTPVLNSFDVVVAVSSAMGRAFKESGINKPIVLWAHHASNQPAVQPLHDPAERALYAGFAMVSQWQAETYNAAFGVDLAATKVMRNAVSPAFLKTTPTAHWLKTGRHPVLGYSSTPYRGLDILLLAFSSIRKQLGGATLRIFSGMWDYSADAKDSLSALYDLAQALPGVTYVGPLPQPRLAEEMADVDIWAYPSTFEETSCISAMEAMVSGNLLVSTMLGALPETTAGFAKLIDMNTQHTLGSDPTRFANHLVAAATEFRADPAAALDATAKQIEFARTNYTWGPRATEWGAWLDKIAGQ